MVHFYFHQAQKISFFCFFMVFFNLFSFLGTAKIQPFNFLFYFHNQHPKVRFHEFFYEILKIFSFLFIFHHFWVLFGRFPMLSYLERINIPSKNIIYCIIKIFQCFFIVQKFWTSLILVRVLVKSNFLCYSIIYLACVYENFQWVLEVTIWLLLTVLLD